MAATGLQANWTGVQHNSITFTKVTAVTFSQGGSIQEFAGDTDRYPTVMTNLMTKPTASITSGNNAQLMGVVPGTSSTLAATHKDAKLQSAGDIVYALANAVSENATASGPFGQYGTSTLNFRAFSADGTTNPLSFTRV